MNMYFLLTFLLTISPRKSTQSVHQIVQFQSQKCKSSFVWEGGHPPPRPSPRSGASRPRLRFPYNIANLAPPRKNSCVRPCTGSIVFMHSSREKTSFKAVLKLNGDKYQFNICMFYQSNYTERQKQLITSSERHSLKSPTSKWIIFAHRLAKGILKKHI